MKIPSLPQHDRHYLGRPLGLVIIMLYKALWGTAEIVSGVVVFFSFRIIARELVEDPQDQAINWFLSHVNVSAAGARDFGLVLIALGIMKLLLAAGLWYRSWAVRNVLLVFFAAILVFGVYLLSLKFTPLKAFAVFADALVTLYLWKFLPKHLVEEGLKPPPAP